jgi:hypothetical protein
VVFYKFRRGGGVRLSPLGTSVTTVPTAPAPDVTDVCGAVGGMRIGRETEMRGENLPINLT